MKIIYKHLIYYYLICLFGILVIASNSILKDISYSVQCLLFSCVNYLFLELSTKVDENITKNKKTLRMFFYVNKQKSSKFFAVSLIIFNTLFIFVNNVTNYFDIYLLIINLVYYITFIILSFKLENKMIDEKENKILF